MLHGRYPDYAYSHRRRLYAQHPDGTTVVAPDGWVILPEGQPVPSAHREFNVDECGRWIWCCPRQCRSTMTPIEAGIWGHVVAFAVPV